MPDKRVIHDGDEYTEDELAAGEVDRESAVRAPEEPVEVQGEPWGWTKPGPRPRGWREDENYGSD